MMRTHKEVSRPDAKAFTRSLDQTKCRHSLLKTRALIAFERRLDQPQSRRFEDGLLALPVNQPHNIKRPSSHGFIGDIVSQYSHGRRYSDILTHIVDCHNLREVAEFRNISQL